MLWLILDFYAYSRIFLAMSIDRLLPRVASNITKKSGSPYVGILALTGISMIMVPIYEIYEAGFYVPLVYLMFVFPMITVTLTSISAAVFAIRHKDYKMGSIGIISALLVIISFVLLSFLPSVGMAAGTVPSMISVIILIAVIIGVLIWYLFLKWYFQKKYNMNIKDIFKELPPE
jgi:amino acid transporter